MTIVVGVEVQCETCGADKNPLGRPAMHPLCTDECDGYHNDPRPGYLWPGEESHTMDYPCLGPVYSWPGVRKL